MRLFSNPRPFSEAERRQASSAPGCRAVEQLTADSLLRVVRCWIEGMRAGVEDNQRVHLKAQFHLCAGLARAGIEGDDALLINGDFAEPV